MFKAQIVDDSLSPQGDRLVSVLCTFPRIILAEVNTHRMLSKNTSSSRAIPFKKMVEAVNTNPFIPIAWQKDHSGMQGSDYLTSKREINLMEEKWLEGRDQAVLASKRLNALGITKQLCNRLLEPFMWTTMLITGSIEGGWDNFFNLRCPKYSFEYDDKLDYEARSKREVMNMVHESELPILDKYNTIDWLKRNNGAAEIHMMHLAELIYDAFNESTPKQLKAGEWHIPFDKQLSEIDTVYYGPRLRVKVSTAMGARTSYTIVGDEKELNIDSLLKLDDKLIVQNPPHSSPMEHCSRAMTADEYMSFYKGEGANEQHVGRVEGRGWCRNYRGFIQRRHLIETGQDILIYGK